MQAIRDWLRANPERAQELMHRNERFIFFRLLDGPGPIGAQGVPLLRAARSRSIPHTCLSVCRSGWKQPGPRPSGLCSA